MGPVTVGPIPDPVGLPNLVPLFSPMFLFPCKIGSTSLYNKNIVLAKKYVRKMSVKLTQTSLSLYRFRVLFVRRKLKVSSSLDQRKFILRLRKKNSNLSLQMTNSPTLLTYHILHHHLVILYRKLKLIFCCTHFSALCHEKNVFRDQSLLLNRQYKMS